MCSCENYACAITIIISLLLGFFGGFLYYLGILTNIIAPLFIAIIITLLISIFLFILVIIPRYTTCIRNSSPCIITGVIGGLLTTIIALSINITPGIISSILVGIIVFFLSIMIIKFFQLLNCIINYNFEYDNSNNCECNNCERNSCARTNNTNNRCRNIF